MRLPHDRIDPEVGKEINKQIDLIHAELKAQSLLTEILMHSITFDIEDFSRTRLLNALDIAHRELATGLGDSHKVVQAFEEKKASLRSLLVSSLIQAESDIDDGE
jgi:hypothetical protein